MRQQKVLFGNQRKRESDKVKSKDRILTAPFVSHLLCELEKTGLFVQVLNHNIVKNQIFNKTIKNHINACNFRILKF